MIVGFAFDLGQQQLRVVGVLQRIQAPATETARLDVVGAGEGVLDKRNTAVGVLMQHTLVTPGQSVPEQLPTPVGGAGSVAQLVDIGGEAVEVRSADQQIVGVDDPDVIAVSPGQCQRLGAVASEVVPGPLVYFTGNTQIGHVGTDHILSSVIRTGIHDHPRRDERCHRVQHLTDYVRLVTNDHVEADRRVRLRGFFQRVRPPR